MLKFPSIALTEVQESSLEGFMSATDAVIACINTLFIVKEKVFKNLLIEIYRIAKLDLFYSHISTTRKMTTTTATRTKAKKSFMF